MSVEEWTGKLAGVKQGSGVVGKLCTVAIFAFVALGIGLWSMPKDKWDTALVFLGGMTLIAFVLMWFVTRTLKYAADHPEEAAMEGSDLLQLRKLTIEQASREKGLIAPGGNVDAPQRLGEKSTPSEPAVRQPEDVK